MFLDKRLISIVLYSCAMAQQLDATSTPSQVSDGQDRGKNYRGTIIDVDGKSIQAEHITIAGINENITVYERPNDLGNREYNPYTNQRTVCLKEVSKIEPKMVGDKPEIAEFRKAEQPIQNSQRKQSYANYIDIKITFYDKDKKTKNEPQDYIIEENRYIECKIPHGRKKISFARLKSLTIQHGDRQGDCDEAKALVKTLDSEQAAVTNPETKNRIAMMIDKLKKWIFNTCD